MTFIAGFILFIAAVLGGALNSVAGGGSFLTFPSLIFAGVRPIQANATSTVALWPGSVASVSAYRKELATLNRVVLLTLGITSLIGGIGGAILLLSTPQATFLGLVPYLMLLATLLFAFSPRITAMIRKSGSGDGEKDGYNVAHAGQHYVHSTDCRDLWRVFWGRHWHHDPGFAGSDGDGQHS
ncbi:MAG: sulfite exporter TauE/SafE family protein [Chloroflexi bacterium]|nr:MAG: sulfite exporter TauE/SafE family protein [Chloroflexota bacterium]